MSFEGQGNYVGCGYCGERIGAGGRKSSIDCMESPTVSVCVDSNAEKPRRRISGINGRPLASRRVQHSINNPIICEDCQKGINSLARACWEINKEKAS